MRLEDQALEILLKGGENFRVEFKEKLSEKNPTNIRKAICAFANDLSGSDMPGIFFIGVDDKGKPMGLDITDKMQCQLASMKSDGHILPPPAMLVEKRKIMAKDLAVVTVKPSDSPPVRYKGCIYVRNGPSTSIATAQEEAILNEKRRAWNRPFDIQPVPNTDISVLDQCQFEREYLLKAFSIDTIEDNDRSIEERLAALKMIASLNDPTPTVVGLLTLGISPLDYIDNAWIQFLRIDGTELSDDVIDEEKIGGNLALVVRRVEEKMNAHIHTRVDLETSDTERRIPSYPMVALQQILRNAIMHRSYENTHAPIRVTWFNDRIEFQNPGGPFGNVTKRNFGKPGITDYRNPNLAEVMKVLGFVQRFGVGIALARKALADNENPEPEFQVEDNTILVVINGKRK